MKRVLGMISWVTGKWKKWIFQDTMDIWSLVNMTYLPIMWFRGMDEFRLRDHDTNVAHHIFPMCEGHFFEKYKIPYSCILKRRDPRSRIQKYFREISDIPNWYDEIRRSTEKPSRCSDTVSDIRCIIILRASKIRCREDFFESKLESHRIKSKIWRMDDYFHIRKAWDPLL